MAGRAEGVGEPSQNLTAGRLRGRCAEASRAAHESEQRVLDRHALHNLRRQPQLNPEAEALDDALGERARREADHLRGEAHKR